jgi:hypothetical protein
MIDAIDNWNVATTAAAIPRAFFLRQTDMPEGKEDRYFRLDGTMTELLARLYPRMYQLCMYHH